MLARTVLTRAATHSQAGRRVAVATSQSLCSTSASAQPLTSTASARIASTLAPPRSHVASTFCALSSFAREFATAASSTPVPAAPAAAASSSSSPDSALELPRVVHTISELRSLITAARARGGRVGFVPTMGALHSGHVGLAARGLAECDMVVVSVFVNPTQFLPGEDLAAYPRTLDADLRALAALGADAKKTFSKSGLGTGPMPLVVFAPSVQEMYPLWPRTGNVSVELAGADSSAEGARRPGHFKGVATVVAKLLHVALCPEVAYFGQKDGMQCVVVRALVRELDFPTEVRICPTQRAPDGLALSSRNVYLSAEERAVAPVLYRALSAANDAYLAGERSPSRLRATARLVLESQRLGTLEYVSLASADTGIEVADSATALPTEGATMLSIAYKLGKPRLIDNCILGEELKPGTE